jgi:uncharacterized protein (TIGR02284 family)
MISLNDQQIDVLNGLISTTLDSADGYGEAAKDAKNPHFKHIFSARAMERRQMTAELQVEVRGLGGEPRDSGSALAAGHRMFLNLKSAVSGRDQDVINEVEIGEDYIKARYETALKENCMSASVKAVIAEAYQRINAEHNDISNLKRAISN